jgi:hypothetical protein
VRAALAVSLLAAALASGCGGDDEDPRWPGPGQGLGTLDVTAFNEHADDVDGTWERSAALTSAEFVRVDRSTARNVSIASRGGPEDAPEALVEVVLDGLLDDSVRARRFVLELDRSEEREWRIRSAVVTQRCWPGRGQQAFRAAACV